MNEPAPDRRRCSAALESRLLRMLLPLLRHRREVGKEPQHRLPRRPYRRRLHPRTRCRRKLYLERSGTEFAPRKPSAPVRPPTGWLQGQEPNSRRGRGGSRRVLRRGGPAASSRTSRPPADSAVAPRGLDAWLRPNVCVVTGLQFAAVQSPACWTRSCPSQNRKGHRRSHRSSSGRPYSRRYWEPFGSGSRRSLTFH